MILGDFYSHHKFQNSIQKYEVAGDLLSSVKHNPNKHRQDQWTCIRGVIHTRPHGVVEVNLFASFAYKKSEKRGSSIATNLNQNIPK